MTDVRIELNSDAVKALLKSDEMQAILEELGSGKASECGAGYGHAVHVGVNRAYCNVYPITKDARQDNLDNNTLEKVVRT